MTSPLRRKRPTTAWSISATSLSKWGRVIPGGLPPHGAASRRVAADLATSCNPERLFRCLVLGGFVLSLAALGPAVAAADDDGSSLQLRIVASDGTVPAEQPGTTLNLSRPASPTNRDVFRDDQIMRAAAISPRESADSRPSEPLDETGSPRGHAAGRSGSARPRGAGAFGGSVYELPPPPPGFGGRESPDLEADPPAAPLPSQVPAKSYDVDVPRRPIQAPVAPVSLPTPSDPSAGGWHARGADSGKSTNTENANTPAGSTPKVATPKGTTATVDAVTTPESSWGAMPTLDEQLTRRTHVYTDLCPSPKDLKSIRKITDNIEVKSQNVPIECQASDDSFRARHWRPVCYTWTASATCNKPLYFEEPQLERYGHSTGRFTQPIVSAVHFFATVPLLPYFMGVYPVEECQYTLGYYRPGGCAPYMLDPFPLSVRGAFCEGMVLAGGAVAF